MWSIFSRDGRVAELRKGRLVVEVVCEEGVSAEGEGADSKISIAARPVAVEVLVGAALISPLKAAKEAGGRAWPAAPV